MIGLADCPEFEVLLAAIAAGHAGNPKQQRSKREKQAQSLREVVDKAWLSPKSVRAIGRCLDKFAVSAKIYPKSAQQVKSPAWQSVLADQIPSLMKDAAIDVARSMALLKLIEDAKGFDATFEVRPNPRAP